METEYKKIKNSIIKYQFSILSISPFSPVLPFLPIYSFNYNFYAI